MDPKAAYAYAHALGVAFAEDLKSPSVAWAVQRGGLTKQQFTRIVHRDVARGLAGQPGPVLFPNVRAFARQAVDISRIQGASAGQLLQGLEAAAPVGDVSLLGGLASLGGAIAGAVGAIWGAKIQTDGAKSLAKIQLQEAQIVQNSQSIAAKSALIQNATASGLKANADGEVIDPATGKPLNPIAAAVAQVGQAAQQQVGGIPAWGIAAGAAAFLTGGYYMLKG